jgi:ribose/xylose/arabinose/galactoside ABC-type transport system permease subunit
MKQLTTRLSIKAIFATLMLVVINMTAFAQETTTTKVDISTDSGNWFSQPWVWVIGVIVFVILLIALMGGGGSSYRKTRTVRRDDLGGRSVTETTTTDDI